MQKLRSFSNYSTMWARTLFDKKTSNFKRMTLVFQRLGVGIGQMFLNIHHM